MNGSPTDGKRPPHLITGTGGEDAACKFLEGEGYTVVCRNFRAVHDEIDIIAETERYIVFVEVKTRRYVPYSRYGRPSSAVGARKRACLARAAEAYIRSHPSSKFYRFDVVEVLICSDRYTGEGSYKFNHMKGVFGARGRIWI